MIGQEHLLIYANTGSLLTKIDYKLWEMNVVKRYPSLGPKTRVDALDSRKFIIKSYREFVTCSLKNDSITFVTRNQNLDILNLRYSKLIGNQLLGFRETYRDNNAGIRVWNYCNIDLDTLTEQAVEVPMILGENRFLCQFDVSSLFLLFLITTNFSVWLIVGLKIDCTLSFVLQCERYVYH
jgi:hypothetical protein